MSYHNEEFETLPRQALEALQLKRLQATVARVQASVPFYRQSFERAGIISGCIKSLDDLRRLPFTVKQDMRDSYPYGLFAAPMDDIVRIHASSGTTGKPTVVGYTRKDIEIWSELMARSFAAAGVHKGDIIHNAYGYGLFTGGLGAHYGAERLGASVIPMSGGNTKKQIMIMKDFGSTVLTCTPSYSLFMAEAAREEGVDFRQLKLHVGIFGAEPWSESMRAEIEQKLNLCAIDIYGLSEIMGPGVAIECREAKKGLHIWEDHFIPEIINPETGEVLPEGERGELVITTITKEGIPLIRYRTRDITSLTYEPCSCGRTHARLSRMTGRSDDMLIIRGVNVFPSQIESILMRIEGVEPHYLLIIDRKDNLDTLEVQVEVDEQLFSDEIKVLQALSHRIEKEIKDLLGVTCKVRLVEPQTIARSEGKAKRVIDNRLIS
ncbi:phenylacetate--CoA ligase [Geobacter sulfurreducens]|jgi:phenylacetate-CoA ligase|uniref:Phenylacetate-coenzyme A ligase n=1 Tax=Geobacter sulfurreducens (strain ATCC 51573 / DSM 12127 / PCA) TaxID=243231 RepID=Q74CD7_GEOSL|nr:phenylacetate--CoA ligase [Geobacter sulfurreducens]AAR35114.1 phenylacetate--coenzyme A ligase [Geobacter sulfurreducens PCA]ADI84574.1 phenylacetate--coenzyme A ligase [Geobacter sulfurreducens KN400]AJY71255.1 phenylacetate--CoA ligase [Geobacter sulfurreducens]QVW33693.1 phenylacetate--CoA ligase [Geobacter sulfurreducens]UAC05732.1 phenylacetate--CoA ligase [Geobacter sulfurreducens]